MLEQVAERVATLWIGPKLSFLERLSLKSFHDIGQTPILYLYDDVEDPPEYVEIRDAREVMDETFVQRYWGKDKLDDARIHADIFRVLLMRKTDHIWIDADVYALHPHVSTDGYLFAARNRRFIPNGVMRIPRDSPAILEMEKFVSATEGVPPWWTEEQIALQKENEPDFSFENLPVGVTGPEAFGYFVRKSGELKHSKTFDYLYPILARHSTTLLFVPSPYDLAEMREKSMSLHLYATAIRRKLFNRMGGVPPEGSLLHDLCMAHDIDFGMHPIEHRDPKKDAQKRRDFYQNLEN